MNVSRLDNFHDHTLRSKRFQSSYCAKVSAEAKKKVPSFPSPSPVSHVFFALVPAVLDEPCKETLARQATTIIIVGPLVTMIKPSSSDLE